MTADDVIRDHLDGETLVEHVPGFCSDHPNQRLVTHRRARVGWWHDRTDRNDPPTVCPMDGHTPYDRERCGWCGRSLDEAADEGALSYVSPKRAYCRRRGDMCRIDAHRARRRGRAFAPATIGG